MGILKIKDEKNKLSLLLKTTISEKIGYKQQACQIEGQELKEEMS